MYVVNLLEDGKCEEGLDSNDSLEFLINDQLTCGWEEEPDRLLRGLLVITHDETGQIMAVIMWVKGNEEWPFLHVIHSDGSVKRYRRIETEKSYRAEEVA
jgi:hypothetical protein